MFPSLLSPLLVACWFAVGGPGVKPQECHQICTQRCIFINTPFVVSPCAARSGRGDVYAGKKNKKNYNMKCTCEITDGNKLQEAHVEVELHNGPVWNCHVIYLSFTVHSSTCWSIQLALFHVAFFFFFCQYLSISTSGFIRVIHQTVVCGYQRKGFYAMVPPLLHIISLWSPESVSPDSFHAVFYKKISRASLIFAIFLFAFFWKSIQTHEQVPK